MDCNWSLWQLFRLTVFESLFLLFVTYIMHARHTIFLSRSFELCRLIKSNLSVTVEKKRQRTKDSLLSPCCLQIHRGRWKCGSTISVLLREDELWTYISFRNGYQLICNNNQRFTQILESDCCGAGKFMWPEENSILLQDVPAKDIILGLKYI